MVDAADAVGKAGGGKHREHGVLAESREVDLVGIDRARRDHPVDHREHGLEVGNLGAALGVALGPMVGGVDVVVEGKAPPTCGRRKFHGAQVVLPRELHHLGRVLQRIFGVAVGKNHEGQGLGGAHRVHVGGQAALLVVLVKPVGGKALVGAAFAGIGGR